MPGNSFGRLFKVTTFGESHGIALGAIIDGCPPGIELREADLQKDLDRRKPGQSKFTTQRRESDNVQILSGVFEGKTTGTPIGITIKNSNQKSQDYDEIKDQFRPGHADFTYFHKYGTRDYRGGGRSSARETAMRVAAGAIAKKILKEKFDSEIFAYVAKIGNIDLEFKDKAFIEKNPFFCADPDKILELEKLMQSIRKQGESIGAQVNVVARNIPVGIGEPVFDRLDAEIAKALMSINAVKAVAIGDGFDVVSQKGSECRDEYIKGQGFISNHAGGVLGGISSGQEILASIALKPTSSILFPGRSINIYGEQCQVITKGRHDPCVGIRAVSIAEAMLALVLVDQYLQHKAQNL